MLPLIAGAADKSSDWISAPKPQFPVESLKKGSEGSVKLQLVLAKDGRVVSSHVLRTSGDPVLDTEAQAAVAKWQMKPAAIKPSDLTSGRPEIIEFKQRVSMGLRYADRTAYFDAGEYTDRLMYAPFPSYPQEERRRHHTGTALIGATTGPDGKVSDVALLKSSGYHELDRSALAAVRLWRVHKQYAGMKFKQPITFAMPGSAPRVPNFW